MHKEGEKHVFCGGDHCSGMWNIPCCDRNHPMKNDQDESMVAAFAKCPTGGAVYQPKDLFA